MVLPISVAPTSSSCVITGEVRAAGAWLASQSGLPQQQTWPSTSKMSLAAKSSPLSGPPARPGIRMSTWRQKALRDARSGAGGVVVIAAGLFRLRILIRVNAADDDIAVRQDFGRGELRHRFHEQLERLQQLGDTFDGLFLRAFQGRF